MSQKITNQVIQKKVENIISINDELTSLPGDPIYGELPYFIIKDSFDQRSFQIGLTRIDFSLLLGEDKNIIDFKDYKSELKNILKTLLSISEEFKISRLSVVTDYSSNKVEKVEINKLHENYLSSLLGNYSPIENLTFQISSNKEGINDITQLQTIKTAEEDQFTATLRKDVFLIKDENIYFKSTEEVLETYNKLAELCELSKVKSLISPL